VTERRQPAASQSHADIEFGAAGVSSSTEDRSCRSPPSANTEGQEVRQARALRVPHVRDTCGPSRQVMANRNGCPRALSSPSQVVPKLTIDYVWLCMEQRIGGN
jgi:hypothetical protein